MKRLTNGFTLIELLVVIAIIGILSSIVLSSLNQARSNGNDAAIKADLAGIRAQTAIMYDDNSCYGDSPCNTSAIPVSDCPIAVTTDDSIFDSEKIIDAIAGAVKNSDNVTSSAKCSEDVNGEAWAISVKMKTDPTQYWCVDSTGQTKQITGPHAADAEAVYQCP